MNILSNKQPAAAPEQITGTEAIRRRVWARWRKAHLARTCTDLDIALPALEAFAQGTGSLPEAALHALTKEFFYNARFDPVADRLIDTRPPASPVATAMSNPFIHPNPVVQKAIEDYQAALKAARPPEPPAPGPQPPDPAKPNPFRRPGFAA